MSSGESIAGPSIPSFLGFTMTRPAYSVSPVPVGVLVVILMAIFTLGFGFLVRHNSAIPVTTPDVYFARHWFQMKWVNACTMRAGPSTRASFRIVAKMIQLETIRDRADEKLIGNRMGSLAGLAAHSDLTISSVV